MILGMFPQTGEWAGGEAAFPAAIRALDQINQREDVLPGYYLNLSAYDTRVNIHVDLTRHARLTSILSISVHPAWAPPFYTNCSTTKRSVVSTAPY